MAEMIKYASSNMKGKILGCFNDALQGGAFDESWKSTIFKMLPKSENLQEVGNWRPTLLSIRHTQAAIFAPYG